MQFAFFKLATTKKGANCGGLQSFVEFTHSYLVQHYGASSRSPVLTECSKKFNVLQILEREMPGRPRGGACSIAAGFLSSCSRQLRSRRVRRKACPGAHGP